MRIELEKRAKVSTLFSILSPFIAFLLTIVFGGIMFALLGKDRVRLRLRAAITFLKTMPA